MRILGIALVFALLLGSSGCLCDICESVCATCAVEALFVSPSIDNVIEARLIKILDEAKQTILLAMYSFTDDQLGDAVVRAYTRGVNVRVILDGAQDAAQGGEYQKLRDAGIPIIVENVSGLMHHKFLVVDGLITVTGSYNWTEAANRENFENIVVIVCREVAQAFTAEFNRIWEALSQGQRP